QQQQQQQQQPPRYLCEKARLMSFHAPTIVLDFGLDRCSLRNRRQTNPPGD
ncbi:hypothetical protein K0M31_004029, partial [Melipona bicolor]